MSWLIENAAPWGSATTAFRKPGVSIGPMSTWPPSCAACSAVASASWTQKLTFQCVGTLSLRGGQITLQGLIEVQGEDDPGPFKVAITGGTGKYSGAGGQATVRDVGDESIYKLRFDSAKKKHHGKKKHSRH